MSAEVRAGAALLDEKRPGWYNEIDIKTLDISDEGACVLGQLYGDFYDTISDFEIDCCEHGFCDNGNRSSWLREIRKRKNAEILVPA